MPPGCANCCWRGLAEYGRRGLLVAAVAAVLVQLVGLYLPGSDTPSTLPPGADKVAHLVLFAVPSALVVILSRRWFLTAVVFGLHAVASELIQAQFVPGRTGDLADLAADLVGVAVGVVVGLWWIRREASR